MIRLRKILLSNKPFIIVLFIALLYTFIYINIDRKSLLSDKTLLIGYIEDIKQKDDKVILKIKIRHEHIIGYYNSKSFHYELNDKIKVIGDLEKPDSNTVINNFNYKKYLYYNKTYYLIKINKIELIKKNSNIFYYFKNLLIKRINRFKSKTYLNLFILGSKKFVNEDVYASYQNNGISHLFCVSGMHVSLFSLIGLFILKTIKVEETRRYIIIILFLLLYLFLTGFAPSILRSVIFFTLLSINKIYYFYIKPINLLFLTLSICLFINPLFIINIGFLISFTITFYLIFFSKYLSTKSKVKNLFLVSLVSFIAGIPICIYNFYNINLLSIIYNIFFVPFVSFIIFPMS